MPPEKNEPPLNDFERAVGRTHRHGQDRPMPEPKICPPRYEQSFTPGEIQALDYIVQVLLRGGTPTMVTRHKEFASLCRKVIALKAAAKEGTD